MSKSTTKKHSELLHTQTSANENQNKETSSEELFKRQPIENTPFTIIGNPEHGFFLSFGRYRLSEPFSTPEQIFEYLENHQWNIITSLCIAIFETQNGFFQETKHKYEHTDVAAALLDINKKRSLNKKPA